MLTLELNGQRYSKTAHARALMQSLTGRNRASIEFKHCNISAVMLTLGYPYINGYKPRANFQSLMLEVIEEQSAMNALLQEAAQAAVERPATAIGSEAIDAVWVPRPRPMQVREMRAPYLPRFSPAKRDFLTMEARNRSLGRAGELLILELEARRLRAVGKKALSERVEHVAITQGDGLGYDILSFEESGRERLIEVKTTAFGELTPFFVSRNELARSELDSECYRLYRLFDFRNRPRVFELPGSITTFCNLDPTSYRASLSE